MQRRAWPFVFAGVAALCAWAAFAQNLDEGKTAPQLFASDCAACHRGPQGLAKNNGAGSLSGFLRQHYTSSARSAGLLAAYLAANPGNSRSERQKAGTAAGTADEPETRANRKNREKTARHTDQDRRGKGKSRRPGAPEPAASEPSAPPPAGAAQPTAPAPRDAATDTAPPPAPSGEAPPAPAEVPAAQATARSEAPAAAAAAAAPSPPPALAADQAVFSAPLP